MKPDYRQQTRIFKALAQPVRLQILEILSKGPACVCDLVTHTGQRQPYFSQELIILKEAGLVDYQSEGTKKFYYANVTKINEILLALQLLGQETTPESRKNIMPETKNNNLWHGVLREEIEWHPIIIAARCVGCGLCVASCGRNVYAFDYEANKPVVIAPMMCMVGCTTCATNCTRDAIEFPSTGYIRQLIRERKVIRQAKEMLRTAPEKYDVKLLVTNQLHSSQLT